MKPPGWWRRGALAPVSQARKSDPETAELARLELMAEQAYAAMYDVPPLCSTKGDYDDARRYFQQAIEEATRLGLTSEAARLSERRDRVGAVYNSQFRGL